MPPIDLEQLHRLCGTPLPEKNAGLRAVEIVESLGEPLARAWLRPAVIAAAENRRATIHGSTPDRQSGVGFAPRRGLCQLLLLTESRKTLPLLRKAFVLPVQWRKVRDWGETSPRLPQRLADLARSVLHDLDIEGLSLHLPAEFEEAGVDMCGLPISPASAWAALATAALMFDDQGDTMTDVMVTAAWSREPGGRRGWFGSVAGVRLKLAAAARAGARIVFVPRANAKDVGGRRRRGNGPEVKWLSNELREPRAAIKPLLVALEAKPTAATGAEFKHRCRFYTRMRADEADAYYREEILEEACRRMRERLPADPRLQDIGAIVFIAGRNIAVPCLLTRLFNPDHILMLHDGGCRKAVGRCEREIAAIGRDAAASPRTVLPKLCDARQIAGDVARHMTMFVKQLPPDRRLLIDLTPGYMAFKLAVLKAAPEEAVLAFVHSPQSADSTPGTVLPGSEELRIFDWPR